MEDLDLKKYHEYAAREFPLLLPDVERIQSLARMRYLQAGKPNGDTDAAAYLWYMNRYRRWKLRQRLNKTMHVLTMYYNRHATVSDLQNAIGGLDA